MRVEFVMWLSCSRTRRVSLCLFVVFCGALAWSRSVAAQRAIPDAAPLNNFNPLCDSSLIHCLDIDHFAGHAYGHLQVLPATNRRGAAAVFPFGATLGLFGRVAGGISTAYTFWKEGDATMQQLGPLRLSLSGRLLPLFSSDGDTEDATAHGFQLGVVYEHEVRVGPFSGANSLGLLSNLASLHIVGSKWLGPFQLSGSVGGSFDWSGSLATGTVAGQIGWLVPGFKQLKIFLAAMGRGFPAYVKKDALLLLPDAPSPIHAQGLASLGLAFRVHRRVDLGVEVERGFGDGIAPWAVLVNFLVISGGKEHEGRAVTPVAQLAADVTREFVSWAVEKLQTIDPYLKKDCVLYDDNHQPMTKLGELSADGAACIYQGLRVPIGPHFWKNQGETRVCYDKAATDCFLTRMSRSDSWEPVHPLLVHNDCFAYLNGQPWMRVGKLSADRQRCENQGEAIPVGQTLRPDHALAGGWYCYDESSREHPKQSHRWCIERPMHPVSDAGYVSRRFVGRSEDDIKDLGKTTKQVVDEVASGTPLHATTPVKEAEAAGRAAIAAVKNAKPEDAQRIYQGIIGVVKEWWDKPSREKLAEVAEAGADVATDPLTYLPVAGVLGKGGRLTVDAIEVTADAAKAGKKTAQAVKATERVWTKSARMNAAQLPHRGGKVRYVPPKSWHPSEPLPRGRSHGFMDRFGNEWTKGPSRTAGEPFEWDVQLPDGKHWNVSMQGHITH